MCSIVLWKSREVVTTPGSTKSALGGQTDGPSTLVFCTAVFPQLPVLSKSLRPKDNNTHDEDTHNSKDDGNDSDDGSNHDDWHLCQHQLHGCEDGLVSRLF